MRKSLHPDVRRFKVFVKNNPYVLKTVKNGDKTLQDLFEEYLLFGEEDDIWDTYRNAKAADGEGEAEEADDEESESKETDKNSSKKDSKGTQDILNMLKKVNFNDLQEHLTQFGGVLASVQELLGQFKQNPQQPPQNNQQQNSSPFSFHDD